MVALEDLVVEQEEEHLSVVKVQVMILQLTHLKVTLEELKVLVVLLIKGELEVELQLQGKQDNLDLEELEAQVHLTILMDQLQHTLVAAVVEAIQVLQEDLVVQVEVVQELVTLMQHQEQLTLAVVEVELVGQIQEQRDLEELVDLV